MTQRFDGAITTPDDEILDQTVVPEPERPARPALVDLASALLVVGGITALLGWLGAQIFSLGDAANAGLVPAIFVALNVLAIAMGIAIRRRRYWRLCINLVAISILLYLTGLSSPIAMFYVALYVVVFYALFQHRAWFDGKDAPRPDAP
jgi:hypothetical protein